MLKIGHRYRLLEPIYISGRPGEIKRGTIITILRVDPRQAWAIDFDFSYKSFTRKSAYFQDQHYEIFDELPMVSSGSNIWRKLYARKHS